ncbi:MAG: coenzyme F420-0:L-glutamate ligase [Pseudoxanthomonas sp.]
MSSLPIMLQILPISGLPEFQPNDDVGALIAERLRMGVPALEPGDVVVVTQKIVSKAEGRFVRLEDVVPSTQAIALAAETNKDPALVELVLSESSAVIRTAPNVLITRHRSGHVMANAGIDASNIGPDRSGQVLLLPKDAHASAANIRSAIQQHSGIAPAVLVCDSFGRPWRMGTVNIAIGLAGMPAVVDQRGDRDRNGRELQVTQIAVADAIAAAAGLVMGEASEGLPVAIVRGWKPNASDRTSDALLRPIEQDLFT